MNTILTAVLAFATLGSAAAVLDPTCTDLAGQGTLCHEVVADPATGVDADVVLTVEPNPPASLLALALEPTCQDLAGQGHACADVVADPATGVDADVIVVVEPNPPVL